MVLGNGRSAAPPGLGNILLGVVRAINMPLLRSWPTDAACGLLLGASSGAGRHPLKAPNFISGGVSRRGASVAAATSDFRIGFGWRHVSSAGFLQPSPPWRPLPEPLLQPVKPPRPRGTERTFHR